MHHAHALTDDPGRDPWRSEVIHALRAAGEAGLSALVIFPGDRAFRAAAWLLACRVPLLPALVASFSPALDALQALEAGGVITGTGSGWDRRRWRLCLLRGEDAEPADHPA